MRAYQLPKGGAGIDALTAVDRPMPKPLYRQVLVKVAACSLNYRDLLIVRGGYRAAVRDNVIPLSDGAGEVVEVGPGVLRVKAGDRVAGCFFQRWPGGEPGPHTHTSALGGPLDGMLAEYAVLEEDGVVKLPEHLSLEEGATLPCAGVTAWYAMVHHAKLIAGQAVLLLGTGGVSIFGLQFAHAMGSRPSSPRRATRSLTAPRHSARPAASTTKPTRNGTRRFASSPAGAASTTCSRSAGQAR
jgi:NADPH:quinone reductase-like Zn-dependent oxidoreductase